MAAQTAPDVAAWVRAASRDLADLGEHPRHGPVTLRWIHVHMIEEYARHNGHADLLRELVDGQVGY